ncbi:MAG: hypothetical protein COT14_00760 [Candidatus Diapherotrites archaeon CG08_land_8_20_14_0_20_30_16]|nr:MAG: hypothetical protein COT14_00760 [Candidatus Diapherotrites archaeon CG08_land_8_20_14_0_20_30_16]
MPSRKPRLSTTIRRILKRKAEGKEIDVTHDDALAIHTYFERSYKDLKSSAELDKFLRQSGLRGFDWIISSIKKPIIDTLDVGAGQGELGRYFQRKYGNRIRYFGIDVKKFRDISEQNVVNDNLPEESFDLVFSFFTFPYLTDKFKALKNIINALTVGGVCVIPDFGHFDFNGNRTSNYSSLGRRIIQQLLSNPNLEVIVRPEGGILIRKKASFVFKLPIKFKKALPLKTYAYLESLEQQRVSFDANRLVSCYEYK